ncbi:transmembrane protein, putative (macronuclear) [Tetrahymena thermophila SB210]|uniref:Transmembrane protein, putative n=1 Tax=Tetrahymena thermophila (strain SB210) TaxID=312017 RepID=W7XF66_TETTS|nr:transmembrane protein, putative [Tetrahymena thermophila SB210]EWS76447.1 transmembrane protein, putative [Tetrahymena thermophila SB210]|eukprot:XP_012651018.1 transmembrane protein, putative [Tetrahymena thermophila SB210]
MDQKSKMLSQKLFCQTIQKMQQDNQIKLLSYKQKLLYLKSVNIYYQFKLKYVFIFMFKFQIQVVRKIKSQTDIINTDIKSTKIINLKNIIQEFVFQEELKISNYDVIQFYNQLIIQIICLLLIILVPSENIQKQFIFSSFLQCFQKNPQVHYKLCQFIIFLSNLQLISSLLISFLQKQYKRSFLKVKKHLAIKQSTLITGHLQKHHIPNFQL